jgi:hypothetical protein
MPGKEERSLAAQQKTEGRENMTYAQVTKNSIEKCRQSQQTTSKKYTNQNNATILHKFRNNLVQTS